MPFFNFFNLKNIFKGAISLIVIFDLLYIIFYIKNLNTKINDFKNKNKILNISLENMKVQNYLLKNKIEDLNFKYSIKLKKEKALSNIHKTKEIVKIKKIDKNDVNKTKDTNETITNLPEGICQIDIK